MILGLTIARLLIPLVIFRYPILGIFLVLGMDTLDWELYPQNQFGVLPSYQYWDKFLDIYLSSIFLIYIFKSYKDKFVKRLSIILFVVRFVGVLLFELTSMRIFLFLFPNLFDNFFIFFEFGKRLLNKASLGKRLIIYVLPFLLILKLSQEYLSHVLERYPWEFAFGQLFSYELTYLNNLIWLTLFVVLHVVIFLLLKRQKPSAF